MIHISVLMDAINVNLKPTMEETTSLLPHVNTLFVWDFDWTIVNCNSDEYVPAAFLGTNENERRLRSAIGVRGPTKWHECISEIVNDCMDECGVSMDDVLSAAARMPYLIDVRASLLDVDEHPTTGQAIISDGNDMFIRAFLKKNGMERYFTHGIETNIGVWEKGSTTANGDDGHRFSVVHQSSKYGGHTHAKCPPNLCKSQALLDILERTSGARPRVVYIGDGSNDACPALHMLGPSDVLLARTGRQIHNPNSMSEEQPDVVVDEHALTLGDEFQILSTIESRKKKEGLTTRCRIHGWNAGTELRALVRDILNE